MWKIKVDTFFHGDSVSILNERGSVVCLMMNCGGNKMDNAERIVGAVNDLTSLGHMPTAELINELSLRGIKVGRSR